MKYACILGTLLAATMLVTVTGCTGSDESAIVSPADQRDLLARWNAAAEKHPNADYDFHWLAFTQFPHPTHKGGSEEGYAAFQVVLLTFLEDDDNFQFLKTKGLFDAALPYEFENHCCDTSWTFRQLVDDFAAEDSFGNPASRDRFRAVQARMDQAG